MEIVLVAAMDRDGTIGKEGGLPWHLPRDLRRFKALTLRKSVVMGRRTFESLGGPLKDRENIVLTRHRGFEAPGCRVAHSVEEAVALAGEAAELMVLGGAVVYAAFLPRAHRLELTEIDASFGGDVRFPPFDKTDWELVSVEDHPPDERNAFPISFRTYLRRPSS